MIGTSDPSGVFEVAASISFLKKEKNSTRPKSTVLNIIAAL
jgi:hypothetical protein